MLTSEMQKQVRKTHHAETEVAKRSDVTGLINNSPAVQEQKALARSINSRAPALQLKSLASLVNPNPPRVTELKPAANRTGLPDHLKAGIESLSGMSLDRVKVHMNSSQPERINALAYAQGTDIHVAPGQEKHLPHEAWHVVQQAQGRVQPTLQLRGRVPVNNDAGLEEEADTMGARAESAGKTARRPDATHSGRATGSPLPGLGSATVQGVIVWNGTTLNTDTRPIDRRELLTAIGVIAHQDGFMMPVAALTEVHRLIDSGDTFAPNPATANALMEHLLVGGFLARPLTGRNFGPVGLGLRPGFTGAAAGMAEAGLARRHVIPSSLLGKAVETSGAAAEKAVKLNAVVAFLGRNGVDHQPAANQSPDRQLHLASRRAWELLQNHTGNLWMGPNNPNSARGFIRGPIDAQIRGLRALPDDGFVALAPMVDALRQAPGAGVRENWNDIVEELSAALIHFQEDHDGTNSVPVSMAITVLNEYLHSANFDPPQDEHGAMDQTKLAYTASAADIYTRLQNAGGEDIFAEHGPLDQFLHLDHSNPARQTYPPVPQVLALASSSGTAPMDTGDRDADSGEDEHVNKRAKGGQ